MQKRAHSTSQMKTKMENLKSARLSRSNQNFEEAIRFYEKYFESRKNASVSNNVYREYIDCLLGTKIPSNIANAKKILIDLVDKGDTLAAGRLGNFYRDGLDGNIDIPKAIESYKKGENHRWIKLELVKILLKYGTFNDVRQIPGINDLFNKEEKEFIPIHITNRRDRVLSSVQNSGGELKYHYSLFRNGKLLKNFIHSSPIINWTLKETGFYTIAGKVVGTNKFFVSEIFRRFSANDELSFNQFNNKLCNEVTQTIPFYKLNYPFSDFAIVINRNQNEINLSKLEGLEVTKIHENAYFVGVPIKHEKYFFSGYSHFNDRLIWGSEDFDSLSENDRSEIFLKTGNFSFFLEKNQKYYFGTDFFGHSKIFFSENDNYFVASNRYSLALMLMQALDFDIEINKDFALFSLSMQNSMLTDQPFSQEGMVKNLYFLKTGEYFEFDFSQRKRNIVDGISGCLENNHETYDQLIRKASNEIKNNIKGYVDSKRFSKFTADLTGGLDSRLVFAGLTKQTNANAIFTLLTGGAEREIQCSSRIAEDFDFKYDKIFPSFRKIKFGFNLPETLTSSEFLDLLVSYDLGTCFDPSRTFPVIHLNDYCRITGCSGETCTRPYISLRLFNTKEKNDKKIVDEYYHSYFSRMNFSGKNIEFAKAYLLQHLHNDKGFPENYEQILLQFRNRFHFDNTARISYSTPYLSPLQTVSGFIALYKNLKESNYKIAFDILKNINQDLTNYEFESFKDNVEAAKFSCKEKLKSVKEISTDWKNAQDMFIPYNYDLVNSSSFSKDDTFIPVLYDKIPDLLRAVSEEELLNEDAIRDLYLYFKQAKAEKKNKEILSLFMKLYSLYLIILIKNKRKFNVLTYQPLQFKYQDGSFEKNGK